MRKKVVILGAGFGGIACARSLSKNKSFEVIVIDKNPYHVVHGNLYAVASSPSDLTSQQEMYQSVNIPLKLIFEHQDIKFIQSEFLSIDSSKQKISLHGMSIDYGYLICSLGAQPNFFAIPGAQDYTLPLQTAEDALLLRSRIETAIIFKKNQVINRVVNIYIAGGGIAGVELAAELRMMSNFVSWENNFPADLVKITIVEMNSTILPGFENGVVSLTLERLKSLNIDLLTNTKINEFTKDHVKTATLNLNYDVAVWTAGVEAKKLPLTDAILSKGSRVMVDQYFRVKNYDNIFSIGDQSCFLNSLTNMPLPGTAAQAVRQGRYIAHVIRSLNKNKKPSSYQCKTLPYCFPVGGKWVVFNYKQITVGGIMGYVLRELIWLKYFVSILGLFKGFHYKLRIQNLYIRDE